MGYISPTKSFLCLIFSSQSSHSTTSSQPNRFLVQPNSIHLPAIMQFPTIFLIAATVVSAAAAPVAGGSSAQKGSPIKCQHDGDKWKPGWGGAADKDKYICNTTGLIVSNSVSIDGVLKLIGSYLEHPGLRQHPRWHHCQRRLGLPPQRPYFLRRSTKPRT